MASEVVKQLRDRAMALLAIDALLAGDVRGSQASALRAWRSYLSQDEGRVLPDDRLERLAGMVRAARAKLVARPRRSGGHAPPPTMPRYAGPRPLRACLPKWLKAPGGADAAERGLPTRPPGR